MGLINKVLLAIIVILVAGLLASCWFWQMDRNAFARYKIQVEKDKLAVAQQRQAKIDTLTALNKTAEEKTKQLVQQMQEAEIHYKEELNNVQTQYIAATTTTARLSDKVRLLNSQLSNYPRETVTQYAVTSSDSLAECAATTAEMERLARQYSAEIDRLIAAWPVSADKPTITVVDPKTNATVVFTDPIQIPTQIKDISKVETP
ncbi:MAG: hypothetical protein [Bacteriophage sp.]|nr:MAG: hypothetical protein [Bacteriophage sp.]